MIVTTITLTPYAVKCLCVALTAQAKRYRDAKADKFAEEDELLADSLAIFTQPDVKSVVIRGTQKDIADESK